MKQSKRHSLIYLCQNDCCEARGECTSDNFNQFQQCPHCGEDTDLMEAEAFREMVTGGLDWDAY